MDYAPFITAAVAIASSAIAAFVSLRIAKRKDSNEFTGTANAGFEKLTDQLQEERRELRAIIAEQRQEIDRLLTENGKLRDAAQILRSKLHMRGIEIQLPTDPPPLFIDDPDGE